MCQQCVIDSLKEEGVDIDANCFLTKEAVDLMVLLYDMSANPEKYNITEDGAEFNTGEDIIDPEEGSMRKAMQGTWNACTKADRTMALGAVRYGMFLWQLAKVATGKAKLKKRVLN